MSWIWMVISFFTEFLDFLDSPFHMWLTAHCCSMLRKKDRVTMLRKKDRVLALDHPRSVAVKIDVVIDIHVYIHTHTHIYMNIMHCLMTYDICCESWNGNQTNPVITRAERPKQMHQHFIRLTQFWFEYSASLRIQYWFILCINIIYLCVYIMCLYIYTQIMGINSIMSSRVFAWQLRHTEASSGSPGRLAEFLEKCQETSRANYKNSLQAICDLFLCDLNIFCVKSYLAKSRWTVFIFKSRFITGWEDGCVCV